MIAEFRERSQLRGDGLGWGCVPAHPWLIGAASRPLCRVDTVTRMPTAFGEVPVLGPSFPRFVFFFFKHTVTFASIW